MVLILAGFYALIEWKGWRRWAFPLVVVGMNSIAVYVMSWTMTDFRRQRLRPPLWQGDIGDGRADFSARASRLCSDADLLAHPVLDVPPEDFLKDLSDYRKACSSEEFSVARAPYPEGVLVSGDSHT